MNWNAIRTYLASAGILALVGPKILDWITLLVGCTGDDPLTTAIEVARCTGGSLMVIPPGLQAIAGGIFFMLAMTAKALLGTGTIKQNLLAPAVPVVSANEVGPGTVTPSQVAKY